MNGQKYPILFSCITVLHKKGTFCAVQCAKYAKSASGS